MCKLCLISLHNVLKILKRAYLIKILLRKFNFIWQITMITFLKWKNFKDCFDDLKNIIVKIDFFLQIFLDDCEYRLIII